MAIKAKTEFFPLTASSTKQDNRTSSKEKILKVKPLTTKQEKAIKTKTWMIQ
jgi:hypothetical protein